MKTNAKITKQAFKDWFDTYMDGRTHDESIDELALIFVFLVILKAILSRFIKLADLNIVKII